ncbi:hypothetical protein Dsin_007646 [Dipteronia sinensis]|uniref:Endonuclease/exonuclease/phosphatase domain-containing protein n=1 Tax=Dipteronia sinensis TaxID=43782 RepID=A0AAE0EH16_9ROSI|nr:hypothetical protein Dsin_007646 [Dipteronia sinensis]
MESLKSPSDYEPSGDLMEQDDEPSPNLNTDTMSNSENSEEEVAGKEMVVVPLVLMLGEDNSRIIKPNAENRKQRKSDRPRKHGMSTRSLKSGNKMAAKQTYWNLDVEIAKVVEKSALRDYDIKDEKRRVVRSLVYSYKPSIFFLQESKLKVFDSSVIRRLGGSWLTRWIGVESDGAAGGIISLWNEKISEVKYCMSNSRCIIFVGELVLLKKEIVLCNIYTPYLANERRELWNFILDAQKLFLIPWVMGGDLNDVLDPSERVGASCDMGTINSFKNFTL